MASLPRFIIIHAHGRKATNHDISPLAFSYIFDSVFHSLRSSWLALPPWERTGDLSWLSVRPGKNPRKLS